MGAGEASGDRILASILRDLRSRPEVAASLTLAGFGGPLAAREGLTSRLSLRDLAVNGIGDVLRRGAFLWRTRAQLLRDLKDFKPDAVLLVDYPGMNIPLARAARRAGIPVLYIAPPQLWAYKNPARRLGRLRRNLKGVTLQVLFPFEADSYPHWNPPLVTGHFFEQPSFESALERGGTRLLLCPGSRRGVLRRNLPLWLTRVREFFGTLDGVEVLVPDYLVDDARTICTAVGGGGTVGVTHASPLHNVTITTDRDAAFARAGAAIAFPGTVTLELFLARIPTRVWGVIDPITHAVARRALRGPHIALPNVIAARAGATVPHAVIPEWLGTAADFRSTPPEIPARHDEWNPEATPETVHAVWTALGDGEGAQRATETLRALTSHP